MSGSKKVNVDKVIEEIFETCIDVEFWIAADMWLGVGIECPHGDWRAESPSLKLSGALGKLQELFMTVDHKSKEVNNESEG